MRKSDYEFLNDYKKEIKKEIAALKKRGATYEETADRFNSTGVETFHRGIWYAQSVHRVHKFK